RYGHSACLTDAVDCIVARVRCLVSPAHVSWERLAISLYTKALKSLQAALDSLTQRLTPDILCVTEILALYELLNPSVENTWAKHAAGAAYIIFLQGPQGYEHEFEKTLFMSHLGQIISESIVNNKECFLEQPSWKQTMRSMIIENGAAPERSAMVISLLIHMTLIPRLFRDVTEAICNRTSSSTVGADELKCRASRLRASLQCWRWDY
ncbi:hypothetical protein AOQ84DRAFT_272020, partial [Glonium stellatum]